MKNSISMLLCGTILFAGEAYCGSDGFKNIKCGSDIPKGLVGQVIPDEPVAVIEGRHKDLGLKDLGGSEISESLFLGSWQICGNEYIWIQDNHSVVRDAMPFPPHSKDSPEFMGTCQINNKDTPGIVVAVLKNEIGMKTLPAKAAWRIDEKKARFVKLTTDGLRCPRSGIATQDGGL